jgi:FixJ family two-component response regulator
LLGNALWRRVRPKPIQYDRVIAFGERLPFEQNSGGCRMPKRLLVSVVEDDQLFRESMRTLMRSLGYRVEAFASASDFLASDRLAETACLIADVTMPAMTGIELYRHLRVSNRAVPTILVTAYGDDEIEARVLEDGVVCYLRKPLDEKHLKQCLLSVLRRHG